MERRLVASLGLTAALAFTGCSSEPEPRPLGSDQFYRRDDRGGAITPGPRVPEQTLNGAPAAQPVQGQPTAAERPANAPPTPDALQFVTNQVKPVVPATLPSETSPETHKTATFEIGQYISVGAIIAQVNGSPIYADDVIRAIAPVLAAKAKDLEESQFRHLATTEIDRQVDEMIRNEVAFAAADRNTSADDKQIAERVTQQWRDKLKTENKGSIEEVRRKFREQGQTYDEVAKAEYRRNLVRVFYSKKLFPRIQVTADDLRRYYDHNKDALFTQHDTLTFRLIKISPAAIGSDAAAKQKIDDLAARAARGEDFATIAGEINNDPTLLRNKGLTGPIDRGAYRLDAVEQALWPLNPGDNTPVLKDDGDYYLAHLEKKTTGRVQAFEETAVQEKMLDTLRGEQFAKMRRDLEQSLSRESVVAKNPSVYDTALSMAMQNYPRWHG